MGEISYKDFKKKIRDILWPSGEPRNLRTAHNRFFDRAMQEIQYWVTCNQENNVSTYAACSTLVRCAQSIIESPITGLIKRVYTIANDDWCDKVIYERVAFWEVECKSRNVLTTFTAPANTGMPALQQGFRHAESSTDSTCGRGRVGIFAMHNNRLHLFPWIQSNEKIVVEWDGWKTEWSDDDILDSEIWDAKVEDVVGYWVRFRHEKEYGSDTESRSAKKDYDDGLADLMHRCRLRKEITNVPECDEPRRLTSDEVEDDEVPTVTDEYNFAVIADYGLNSVGESQVADLVKSWSPSDIFANGDCDYIGDYDLSNGQYYQEYIYPYSGAYGSGSPTGTNRFWPTPANHDWDADGVGAETLAKYLEFFTLPGNERYYEVVRGPIHFFLISSDPREPDGRTSTSVQGEWLRVKLALSTAKWKVVLIHNPPYTSATNGDAPGITASRWPFKLWGADIVLSGDAHQYERFEVDDFPYIVCGTGGATLVATFTDPLTTGSVEQYSDYGALKCKGTCTTLLFEFYTVDGTLRDSLELTK